MARRSRIGGTRLDADVGAHAGADASSRYAAGLVAGVATNLLWALAILIPVLLAEQSALALTLGRYCAYGTLSLVLAAAMRGPGVRGLGRREWAVALVFAAAGNVGYFFLFVLAITHAGAPVAAAIIGALPVTVALYGNWRRREFPFHRLTWPIMLLLAGMIVMNVTEQGQGGEVALHTARERVFGVLCAVAALGMWTWYAIANADFLKIRPHLRAGTWSTAIGVATLVLVLGVLPLVMVSGAGVAAIETLRLGGSGMWWRFIAGSLVLGIVVSWGGTLLWNRASELLPVALAGQLIVLETIAGMVYVFTAQRRLPTAATVGGVALLVAGVLLGIRRTRPASLQAECKRTAGG